MASGIPISGRGGDTAVMWGTPAIGVIGFGIDILMRRAENWLVPWKGRS
ncbi:MAG: hypothetical protein KDE06_00095 [Rhodobacteraceae bacterium]|nr:hypothetical protein [Paracoccaceae bacterium]